MKSLNFLTVFLTIVTLQFSTHAATGKSVEFQKNSELAGNNRIIAVNDTFHIVIGCGNLSYSGFVLANDIIPDGITAKIEQVVCSNMGLISFGPTGNFAFNSEIGFSGTLSFKYRICDSEDETKYSEAIVLLFIESDFDCDEIFDEFDLDDDNDGLLDSAEGNAMVDTDYDGIPDVYDIDDDDDGIPDNFEWQVDGSYTKPSGIDVNRNGWDDAYENMSKAGILKIADSDGDGIPDFRDTDSDNDSISDMIEAYDIDLDRFAETLPIYIDKDNDGLDDSFDTVVYDWHIACNSTGSKASFLDQNSNGIQNFRETKTEPKGKDDSVEFEIADFDTEIKMYPNPSNGIFSVNIPNFSNENEIYIQIFNTEGQLKKQLIADNSILNVNLSEYQQGLYFVKINSAELSCTQKMLVQY